MPGGEAAATAPAVVVLAAGMGTRMRSALPKMVHEVAGRPLVEHVVRAAAALEPDRIVLVVGVGAERVREALRERPVEFAVQEEQLGTGHALLAAREALAGHPGPVLVLNGDGPLITPATLREALAVQGAEPGMTLVTTEVEDPTGLGRVIRGPGGGVERIVEHRDASPAEREVREINPGIYLFDAGVWERAARLSNDNAQGEYYITDLPGLYLEDGLPVRAVRAADPSEVLAANDRAQLAVLERLLRDRIRARWLREGVTMIAPEATWIDDEVELARDVVLEPGVILRGRTRVGEGARLGAYSVLEDAEVAPGERVPPHEVRTG